MVLYNCYTTVIRLLYYNTIVVQLLLIAYSLQILYQFYTTVILLLYDCYTSVI